jgi:hypothetical protein
LRRPIRVLAVGILQHQMQDCSQLESPLPANWLAISESLALHIRRLVCQL